MNKIQLLNRAEINLVCGGHKKGGIPHLHLSDILIMGVAVAVAITSCVPPKHRTKTIVLTTIAVVGILGYFTIDYLL